MSWLYLPPVYIKSLSLLIPNQQTQLQKHTTIQLTLQNLPPHSKPPSILVRTWKALLIIVTLAIGNFFAVAEMIEKCLLVSKLKEDQCEVEVYQGPGMEDEPILIDVGESGVPREIE